MSEDLGIATGAINVGGWSIKDSNSTTRITVIDKAGKAVASVPNRPDDLDIARLIKTAPRLLDALLMIANQKREGDIPQQVDRIQRIARAAIAETESQS